MPAAARQLLLALTLVTLAVLLPSPVQHRRSPGDRLSSKRFEVNCSRAAQPTNAAAPPPAAAAPASAATPQTGDCFAARLVNSDVQAAKDAQKLLAAFQEEARQAVAAAEVAAQTIEQSGVPALAAATLGALRSHAWAQQHAPSSPGALCNAILGARGRRAGSAGRRP